MRNVHEKTFGTIRKPVCKFTPGVHTVYPDTIMAKQEWKDHFKLSFMVGWRSEPVYIEDNEIDNKLQMISK